MPIASLQDLDLTGKRVLLRADFNVPLDAGAVASDARIRAVLPSIRHILDGGAGLCIASHLGRPQKHGGFQPEFSLAPIARHLAELLETEVQLVPDWQTNPPSPRMGEIVLLENIRFAVGETDNDTGLARQFGALCDLFVMDAFGTAHRAHASTCGVVQHAPAHCAGLLLQAELAALSKVMDAPARPLVAVVGGSKVSTKLEVLVQLSKRVDLLIPGGGIANTFLHASGQPVGRSLCEPDLAEVARKIMQQTKVLLPVDAITGHALDAEDMQLRESLAEVGDDEMILDLGLQSRRQIAALLHEAGTILWNGPVGAFENSLFSSGTDELAQAIATSPAYSVAGGGDTLAAIEMFGVGGEISYISTGGGAFLEYLEGRELPGIAALEQS